MFKDIIAAVQSMVRPVIAVAFATAVIVGFLLHDKVTADQFLPIATLAIGYWFGDRSARKSSI